MKIAQNRSESLRIAQNRSESLRIAQNRSELLRIAQNRSKSRLLPPLQGENILAVKLDMPSRTTRDYEGPAVAPKIQAALDAALQDEEDIDVDGRSALISVLSVLSVALS